MADKSLVFQQTVYPWPQRAPSRQNGTGGIEGHNIKETSLREARPVAGSFTLSISHEGFFLAPGFFP